MHQRAAVASNAGEEDSRMRKGLLCLVVAVMGLSFSACASSDAACCGKCGEKPGTEKCCQAGAEKCAKCGMNKGSPGCCK